MDSGANFRNATINEPRVFGPQQTGIQTALGRIPITNTNNGHLQGISTQNVNAPPPVPPRPYSNAQQSTIYNTPMGMYGGGGGGGGGMYANPMYGTPYSYGMNPYGMSRYGMYGNSMYSNGMYGNQMRGPMDPESQFIQLAEESSRPAFQSIESLVMAIGNIAAMLDSTFFAVTSSFRAILGVAANVGQLRGVFSQIWSTFALIRGVTWLYNKLLYLLGFSKVDPSTARFNEIFSAAASGTQFPGAKGKPPTKTVSTWPIITFLGLIFATPYLIMKLIGQVSTAAIEESRNPQTWVRPYAAQAIYNYKATNPHELSIYSGQHVQLAPKEVQQTHKLLNTGWALATVDNITSGLIPINYVSRIESKPFASPEKQSALESEVLPQKLEENIVDQIPEINVDKKNNEIYDSKSPPKSNDTINEESTNVMQSIISDECREL